MNKKFCPYCDPETCKPLNSYSVAYSGIEMRLIAAHLLRCRHFPDDYDNLHDHQDAIAINFCPMCGRNLNPEENIHADLSLHNT